MFPFKNEVWQITQRAYTYADEHAASAEMGALEVGDIYIVVEGYERRYERRERLVKCETLRVLTKIGLCWIHQFDGDTKLT